MVIDSQIVEPTPGVRHLHLRMSLQDSIEIPLTAMADWRELLGIDDYAEVLEAFLHVAEHGEPPSDPVTGENVWAEPWALLTVRERAREDEADRARGDGCTEDMVVERAEKAAYDAVHVPVDGDECAMDRCRREARRKLGLPDPAKKCGPETRSKRPVMPERLPAQARAVRPAGGKAQALEVLSDQADYLHECTKRFLHSLTDYDADPLEPEPAVEPEPAQRLLTPAETLAKYQEAK